jgi:putative flavoprotein involved in K+ transport
MTRREDQIMSRTNVIPIDEGSNPRTRERTQFRVVVIGAGQAGLAVGQQLVEAGVDVVILDAAARIGEVWRTRWDSLRLFTAAEVAGLPGFPFPGDPNAFPTKDETADYLEAHARRFHLPVRLGTRVEALERHGDRYVITAGHTRFKAEHVVIATGPYQRPLVPRWAADLPGRVVQIHSRAYRNPAQLPPGDVLVVGAGNTGAELALEAARAGHRVWLSGRDVGQIPSLLHAFNGRLFWFLATRVFTTRTPIGRRIRASMRAHHGGPLVRIRSKDIVASGIQRVGRVVGCDAGRPVIGDGRVLDVSAVLWCGGFGFDFGWVRLPIFAPDGYPLHDQGRVTCEPGLYFVGLPFQRSLSSSTLVGVGRDAALVAGWIKEALRHSTRAKRRDLALAPDNQQSSFGIIGRTLRLRRST